MAFSSSVQGGGGGAAHRWDGEWIKSGGSGSSYGSGGLGGKGGTWYSQGPSQLPEAGGSGGSGWLYVWMTK